MKSWIEIAQEPYHEGNTLVHSVVQRLGIKEREMEAVS
jgi:hypothetical protein